MPVLPICYRLSVFAGRILVGGLSMVVVYLGLVVLGLLPANWGARSSRDGVEIQILSNAVHADLILPRRNEVIDWGRELEQFEFAANTDGCSHVAIGWGDRGFFLNTPTWDDLTVSTAANALLWPSETCLHFGFLDLPPDPQQAPSIRISESQYRRLVDFIRSTWIASQDGRPIQILDRAYGSKDGFAESRGSYHVLNTCNSWVGRGLNEAGVTVPWLSPLPHSPTLYFPAIGK